MFIVWILKNQNVADGRDYGRATSKQYTPTNTVCTVFVGVGGGMGVGDGGEGIIMLKSVKE